MKVSIIIPCYNSSKFFDRLKASILNYLNNNDYEIIFINDKSSCEEKILFLNFLNELNAINVSYIENDVNLGASISRKKAVNKSKGKYIAFLDSDDAWHMGKIALQYDLMEKCNIDILGGLTNVVEDGEFIVINKEDIRNAEVKKLNFLNFLFKNYYSTPSVMVKRDVILDENFSDEFRYSEDYECWRRIAFKYNAYFMLESYTYSFKHPYISDTNSLSTNLIQMSLGELKGLFFLFKKKMPIYLYFMVFFAIIFSFLKALRRMIQSYIG
ncbi:glycosyltransferase family 2 protein [Acinetobacter ursingii]|uniref:glycosyltransferase family 2 protein n=1 Tax=Acinetobacter ursingii TaxID=108980 RepID=UPI003AF695EA